MVNATPISTGVNESTTLFSVALTCTDTGGSGCKSIYYTEAGMDDYI